MSPPNDPPCQPASVAAQPPTILVIDDEQLILDLMVNLLSRANFQTITAKDAESGLALFRSHPVDLVLTDLFMEGSDGFQVLSAISKENPDLPVIVVSGAGDLQDSIQALRLGAWDFICKPVDTALLSHQIDKALARAALLKENARYRQGLQLEVEQRTAQLKQRAEDLEQVNRDLQREIKIRQQMEAKLKEANDRWQTTFDSIPDFISIHDQEYTVLNTNKALADFLGQAPAELIGKKCYQLFHGTSGPWHKCPHPEALVSGQPQCCEVDDPHVGKPLMVSVSPIIVEGKLIGSIHIAKDISQQKRLEEERQKNKNLDAISVLCGGLAHDFNNLLTAVSGYIDLAKMEKTPEQVPYWLNNAKMVTNLASELTKQLLIFSKGGSPVFGHVSVPLLMQDSLSIENSCFSKVRTEVRIDEDIWSIKGDHGQLRTVIRNIFYNAAEAMPNGGLLTIEAHNLPRSTTSPLVGDSVQSLLDRDSIQALQEQDLVLLSFTDQGVGISPEIIDKVFDPYFTTSAKGAIKGKGLGLTLCHSIISKHNGLISISSKNNQGATVSIYLPAEPAASPT